MNPNFLKKAKSSWVHMALASGSLFSLGASPSYYRVKQAYYSRSHSPLITGVDIRMNRPHSPAITSWFEPLRSNAGKEISVVQGRRVQELLIIDAAVPQKYLFYAQSRPGIDVVEINTESAGLAQLINILAGYEGLDAVHLVSHAEAGMLLLGRELIRAEDLQEHPETFAAINKAIKPSGDFLFYGCELAKGEAGKDFLDIIQGHTHADIAASDDLTGQAGQNGDWDLEVHRGDIDATPLAESIAMRDFTGVLQFTGVIDFSQVNDPGDYGIGYGGYYNATFYTSAAKEAELIVDGKYYGTGFYAAGENVYSSPGEELVTLSFTAGETFTANSIDLRVFQGPRTVDIYSNLGTIRTGVIITTTNSTINLSSYANYAGITSLTVREVNAEWMYVGIDNFDVANVGSGFPVSLTGFQADRLGEVISLKWSTASEQFNRGFEIEQSTDGATFEQVGFVEGAGNASGERKYEFEFQNSEAAFFRLKQVDFDGKFSYSPTRFLAAWEPSREPLFYPNPVKGNVFIGNLVGGEMIVLDLYDMQGRQLAILQGNKLEVEQKLVREFETLTDGTYMVHLRVDGKSYSRTLVKE